MQFVQVLVLMWLMGEVTTRHQPLCTAGQYVARFNYGVVGKCVKTIEVSTGFWTHAFHFNLPTHPTYHATRNDTSCSRSNDTALCQKKKALHQVLRQLAVAEQTAIGNILDEIRNIIPDIDQIAQNRKKRGLVDAIGEASEWLFGTATVADIDDQKKAIKLIAQQANIVARDAQRTRHGLATFMNISNTRLDNLQLVLHTEVKNQLAFHEEITNIENLLFQEYTTMAQLTKELSAYIRVRDDALTFQRAVADLANGHLSPHLIEAAIVRETLSGIRRYARRQQWRLILKSNHEIYSHCPYDYARSNDTIIIRLHIPYTTFEQMDLLKIYTYPIPVPGQQGLQTKIRNMPRLILYSSNNVGSIDAIPQFHLIDDRDIEWHSNRETSCTRAILEDDLHRVHQLCEFSVSRLEVPKSILHLSQNTLLLSGYTTVNVACDNHRITNLTNYTCNLCVVQLRCGCSVFDDKGIDTWTNSRCHHGDANATTLRHTVNLIAIQTFYETINATLSSSQLYQPSEMKEYEQLNIPLFEDRTEHILTRDKENSYSLRKIAAAMENESVILHSPTEAMILDLINKHEETTFWDVPWNLHTYTMIFFGGFYVLLVLFILHLRRQLNNRLLELAGIAAIPGARALNMWHIKTITQTTTAATTVASDATTKSILDHLYNQIYTVDAILFVLVAISIITFTIVIICLYKKAMRRQSTVYLQFKSGPLTIATKWITLPDASHFYAIHLSSRRLQLKIANYKFFGIIRIQPDALKVTHTLTGAKIRTPSWHVIPSTTTEMVQAIRQHDNYDVSPILIHTHHVIFPPS